MGLREGLSKIANTLVKGTQSIARDPGKAFGRTGMAPRLGLAAGYLSTGAVTNLMMSNFEERQRAYYGQERYDKYYGGGGDSVRGLVTFGAGLMAFGAMIGRDPISRVIAETRYRGAQNLLLSAATLGLGTSVAVAAGGLGTTAGNLLGLGGLGATALVANKTRGYSKASRMKSAYVAHSRFRKDYTAPFKSGKVNVSGMFDEAFMGGGQASFVRGGTPLATPLPSMPSAAPAMGGSMQMPAMTPPRKSYGTRRFPQNPQKQLKRQISQNVKENVGFVEDAMLGTPYQGAIRTGPGVYPTPRPGPDIRYNAFTQSVEGASGIATNTTQRLINNPMLDNLDKVIRTAGIKEVGIGNVRAAIQQRNTLKNAPRIGQKYLIGMGSLALGGGFLNTISSSSPEAIAGTVGAVSAAGIGYAVHKAKGYAPAAIAIGAGYATYASTARIRSNMPGEGTITDVSRMNSTGVSKMNFSTAGLVQALHNANRKY